MKTVIGVTSGISLYKVLNVIRMLIKAGHEVQVIMTPHATKFVSPLLFQTLSGKPVFVDDFDSRKPLAHIQLGDWCDQFAVIPATANTLAKIAHGMADNLLTSTLLACDKKKILFPAMNVKMYENQVTQENLGILRKNGYEIIDPCYGDLACGYRGKGRLPAEEAILGILDREISMPLKGRKFIVTAGGTVEKIDPVRYISNFSSGKMGIEIAKCLYRKGAEVMLIYGNITASLPSYIPSLSIQSAEDLKTALEKNFSRYDGLFMAAAPADFKSETVSIQKIKKSDRLQLALVKIPDILKSIRQTHPEKMMVGFALETTDYLKNAGAKLIDKGLDFIALNELTPDFNPLGSDENSLKLLSKKGEVLESGRLSKKDAAEWLVEKTLAE